MIPSILTSVKKALGLDESYTAFDPDIAMHINSALSTLGQIGIGPSVGFAIEDETAVWADFTDDPRMSSVRSYVFLKVRYLFDPPTNVHVINAMEKQIEENLWRLSVVREGDSWIDPTPPPPPAPPYWPWLIMV